MLVAAAEIMADDDFIGSCDEHYRFVAQDNHGDVVAHNHLL